MNSYPDTNLIKSILIQFPQKIFEYLPESTLYKPKPCQTYPILTKPTLNIYYEYRKEKNVLNSLHILVLYVRVSSLQNHGLSHFYHLKTDLFSVVGVSS